MDRRVAVAVRQPERNPVTGSGQIGRGERLVPEPARDLRPAVTGLRVEDVRAAVLRADAAGRQPAVGMWLKFVFELRRPAEAVEIVFVQGHLVLPESSDHENGGAGAGPRLSGSACARR